MYARSIRFVKTTTEITDMDIACQYFHYRFTNCILSLLMCQTLNILGLRRNEIVEVPEVE